MEGQLDCFDGCDWSQSDAQARRFYQSLVNRVSGLQMSGRCLDIDLETYRISRKRSDGKEKRTGVMWWGNANDYMKSPNDRRKKVTPKEKRQSFLW